MAGGAYCFAQVKLTAWPGSPLPAKVDLLGVLDAWVDSGKAPGTLTQVSQQEQAPFETIALRPMCRYPLSPRYDGAALPSLMTPLPGWFTPGVT
jgi:Tannase and feruloyl esterase